MHKDEVYENQRLIHQMKKQACGIDVDNVVHSIKLAAPAERHMEKEDKLTREAKKLAAARMKKDIEDPKKGVKTMANAIRKQIRGSPNYIKVDQGKNKAPKYIVNRAEIDHMM